MKYTDQCDCGFGFEVFAEEDFSITKENLEAAMSASPALQRLLSFVELEFIEGDGPEFYLDLESLKYVWYVGPVAMFLYTLLSELAAEKYGRDIFELLTDNSGSDCIFCKPVYPWQLPKGAKNPESEEELVQLYEHAIQLLFGENAPLFTMDYIAIQRTDD